MGDTGLQKLLILPSIALFGISGKTFDKTSLGVGFTSGWTSTISWSIRKLSITTYFVAFVPIPALLLIHLNTTSFVKIISQDAKYLRHTRIAILHSRWTINYVHTNIKVQTRATDAHHPAHRKTQKFIRSIKPPYKVLSTSLFHRLTVTATTDPKSTYHVGLTRCALQTGAGCGLSWLQPTDCNNLIKALYLCLLNSLAYLGHYEVLSQLACVGVLCVHALCCVWDQRGSKLQSWDWPSFKTIAHYW